MSPYKMSKHKTNAWPVLHKNTIEVGQVTHTVRMGTIYR